MLKSIIECHKVLRTGVRLLHQKNDSQPSVKKTSENLITSRKTEVTYEFLDDKLIENAIKEISHEKSKSVLEECKEDLSHVAPYLKPTFNFAAYVNKSETLQELLKLGVDLSKIEKKKDEITKFILGLKFERDVKEHVMFLYSLGLQVDEIGQFITKNPMIFKESLDDLRTRITYLKYKKFNDEMILRIVGKNSFWLSYSTVAIDNRLGFFQKLFSLTGDEVRFLTVKKPRIITYSLQHIKENNFTLKEEMGFNSTELKTILLDTPSIFMKTQHSLIPTFEYLHKTMEISLEDIVEFPKILTCRSQRLKERYLFLKRLNRVQFDPKKANYISMLTMVSGTDAEFATDVAKSSVQAYNEFLKTL